MIVKVLYIYGRTHIPYIFPNYQNVVQIKFFKVRFHYVALAGPEPLDSATFLPVSHVAGIAVSPHLLVSESFIFCFR